MNERTNRANERTSRTNGLISWTSRKLGEPILVYPGMYIEHTIRVPQVTESGMDFLQNLCDRYLLGDLSVDELLSEIQNVANEFSGYKYEVREKLFNTAMQIMSNN